MILGKEQSILRLSNPILWGVIATVLIVLLAGWTAMMPMCLPSEVGREGCIAKWEYLETAPPNEVGDTLAGFAGVLAFVWIIVTVALQSSELRLQREELRLTRGEIEAQRLAAEEMARSLKAQALVLEDERNFRSEARAQDNLKAMIESMFRFLRKHRFGLWSYTIEHPNLRYRTTMETFEASQTVLGDISEDLPTDQNGLRELLTKLRSDLCEVDRIVNDKVTFPGPMARVVSVVRPDKPKEFQVLLSKLESIIDLAPELSVAERQRLHDCDIDGAIAAISVALDADIWAAEEAAS